MSQLTQALPSVTYVIALTPDGALDAFRYANRSMTELLGYPAGALGQIDSPQAWAALIHPDDRDCLMQRLGEMGDMAEGEICETEFRMRGADGGWRWVSARHMVFQRDPSGRVTEIVGAIDDITRARHAQEELAANQRLLSRIAEAVPSTLYVLDVQVPAVNGGLLYSNRSLAQQLGHLEPTSAESSWLHFLLTHLHPDDIQTFAEMLRRQLNLSEGEVLETEYRLQDGEGAWHWMRARDLVFERDSKGAVTQIIGVVEDVTASRHLQDEVRSERDFAQLVLNTLGQGVAVITPAGVCEYINPAGAKILGYEPDALIGIDLSALVPAADQSRISDTLTRSDGSQAGRAEVIEIP
ncbi:MAG TPA: PAS domain-containing protein, partial [Anaerolineales bacterium]|nr:PAS domain-containing protein [Anaerolineales bacterium]